MRPSRILPLTAVLVALGATPAHAHGNGVDVIAKGLDSPRHLAFDNDGDLYVAEAGRGGAGPCFDAGEGPACMGNSGAVTKVDRWGRRYRIASGLASMANVPGNTNAIGPHGITVVDGRVYVTNGGPTEPKVNGDTVTRDQLAEQNPVADLFGNLLRIGRHGHVSRVADVWEFERVHNPDEAIGNPAIDSNAVDVLFDGRRFVIADAGGNAVDVVRPFGGVSNLAVFGNRAVPNPFGGPPVPMQAVPTSVVLGPDGSYYVSQLTGFPFPVGGANVFRVDPATGAFTVAASGFTNIMDLAFGRDGTLYVLEIDHDSLLGPGTDGALFAVKNGKTRQIQLPAGALPMPGGIAVGRDGLYITVNSGSPGGGQVVRVRV